jgi:6-pyruvoyltetrahydropterin/6-carboxytetrahydropterin synthase
MTVQPFSGGAAQAGRPDGPRNGLLGTPSIDGLGSVHEVVLGVVGTPDAASGYIVGIRDLDALVLASVAPRLRDAWRAAGRVAPGALLAQSAREIERGLPSGVALATVLWRPSPHYAIEWRPTMPDHVMLAEQYEFSAAHRLHSPALSDEDNRRIFGKCSNEHFHGHNYRLEVCVRIAVAAVPSFGSAQLGPIVGARVLEPFDHRNLNLDVEEFRAVVPSVENIAVACHARLAAAIAAAGAELVRVTVWETERTSATYPADAP